MTAENTKEYKREPLQAGIYVICGSMFSGKSEELIKKLRRIPYAKYSAIAFAPDVDFRRGKNSINSASGGEYKATSVKRSVDILEVVQKTNPTVDVVAIDEAQFFDMNLVEVCRMLADQGKQVLVAGLDLDFRGEPFGPMGTLKQIATHTQTEHAQCNVCGKEASRTQRLVTVDGEKRPAHYDEPIILVGAEESYEARCYEHHEVPGRPLVSVDKKESLFDGNLKFYLSGTGEAEDLIEQILKEYGHEVFRPSFNEKDVSLLTDSSKEERASCNAAIFGPGSAPVRIVPHESPETVYKPVGIGEARNWAQSVGGPSLIFIRNLVGDWDAPSKALYTLAYGYSGPEHLREQLLSFVLEARKRIKK